MKTLKMSLPYRTLLLTVGCLSGCATSTFTVSSEPPQADVYVLAPAAASGTAPAAQPGGQTAPQSAPTPEKRAVGRTPLNIPMSEFRNIVGNAASAGQYFPVLIERQGFLPETLLVPATRFGTLVTAISVKLRPEPPVGERKDDKTCEKNEKSARAIIDHLFLAQKFAITQQFERAHIELDKVLSDFPTFPRALSMRASIYYAQKNWAESLKWYEEALKADPQMDDAVRMSAKIRAIQSGRAPADDAAAGARNGRTR